MPLITGRAVPALSIALVNNMPDAVLEETERQFGELLDAASGDIPVRVELFSLAGVPRGEKGRRRIAASYRDTGDLATRNFDAAIVTGAEPRHPDLRREPYWSPLTELLDWAERNTLSTVLSCLAAHASVLYSDGIERRPLEEKRFGVFHFSCAAAHVLTRGGATRLPVPHSRWNEVPAAALQVAGYEVLSQSADAGVDLFVKQKQSSLFVHFQGHPEYGTESLLDEYRRDTRRFLRGNHQNAPRLPQNYFGSEAARALGEFQSEACGSHSGERMALFPDRVASRDLQNTWSDAARRIYRNWLEYLVSRKSMAPKLVAVSPQERFERIPVPETNA